MSEQKKGVSELIVFGLRKNIMETHAPRAPGDSTKRAATPFHTPIAGMVLLTSPTYVLYHLCGSYFW